MILDGIGVLMLLATAGLGFYFRMLDVVVLTSFVAFAFGLVWWINYGDRLQWTVSRMRRKLAQALSRWPH